MEHFIDCWKVTSLKIHFMDKNAPFNKFSGCHCLMFEKYLYNFFWYWYLIWQYFNLIGSQWLCCRRWLSLSESESAGEQQKVWLWYIIIQWSHINYFTLANDSYYSCRGSGGKKSPFLASNQSDNNSSVAPIHVLAPVTKIVTIFLDVKLKGGSFYEFKLL